MGEHIEFGALAASVEAKGEAGEITLRFDLAGAALDAAIAEQGSMPLPPYIAGKRASDARDADDYQTLFARTGSRRGADGWVAFHAGAARRLGGRRRCVAPCDAACLGPAHFCR